MTERINFISFFGSRGTFGPYSLQNIGAWCGPQKREGGRAGTSTQVRTQFPRPKENKCRANSPQQPVLDAGLPFPSICLLFWHTHTWARNRCRSCCHDYSVQSVDRLFNKFSRPVATQKEKMFLRL